MCGKKVPTFFFGHYLRWHSAFFLCRKNVPKTRAGRTQANNKDSHSAQESRSFPFCYLFLLENSSKPAVRTFPCFFFGGGKAKKMQRAAKPEMQPFFEEKKQYFPISQVSGESLRNGHMSTRDEMTYLATTTSRQLSLSVKQTKKIASSLKAGNRLNEVKNAPTR